MFGTRSILDLRFWNICRCIMKCLGSGIFKSKHKTPWLFKVYLFFVVCTLHTWPQGHSVYSLQCAAFKLLPSTSLVWSAPPALSVSLSQVLDLEHFRLEMLSLWCHYWGRAPGWAHLGASPAERQYLGEMAEGGAPWERWAGYRWGVRCGQSAVATAGPVLQAFYHRNCPRFFWLLCHHLCKYWTLNKSEEN